MPAKNLGSIIPLNVTKYDFSKPRTIQCTKVTMDDGSYKYARFLGAKTLDAAKASLFASSPIYKDEQIMGAPDGVYTWVFLRSDASSHLYATRVRDIFELGSKHLDILRRVHAGPAKIAVAAGEFKKVGSKITYSLASGSISTRLFDTKPNGTYSEENINSIAEQAAIGFERLHVAGADVSPDADLSKSFASKEEITYADLQHYASLGYRIGIFNEEANCMPTKGRHPAFSGVESYKQYPGHFKTRKNAFLRNYGATIIGNNNYAGAGGKRRMRRTRKMRR